MTDVDNELEIIFKKFVDMGIFTVAESPILHQIEEIKETVQQCRFAWIEITNKCNLRCLHCYNESNNNCENIMSLHNFKIVVDNLLIIGVESIQIIGGEPFFDKYILKDMLDYVVGKFRLVEIFTNGTLITEEWYDYFVKNKIHVALSVYSYNEENHDRVTQRKGSWKKTNGVIRELKNRGINYRICNVLMRNVEIGVRNTDLYHLNKDKDVVRMSGRANFSLLTDDLIRKKLITKQTFQKPISRQFSSKIIESHNCFKDKIYISANMDVFPCVMERRIKHCKIGKDSGITLNNSIINFCKDKIVECKNCEFRYACFDCRPNSLSGNLYEKPWYCTYNPLLGKWEDEKEFILNLKKNWE